VAQGVGPEFKPTTEKKKQNTTNQTNKQALWRTSIIPSYMEGESRRTVVPGCPGQKWEILSEK
jgi:hypothetical protein